MLRARSHFLANIQLAQHEQHFTAVPLIMMNSLMMQAHGPQLSTLPRTPPRPRKTSPRRSTKKKKGSKKKTKRKKAQKPRKKKKNSFRSATTDSEAASEAHSSATMGDPMLFHRPSTFRKRACAQMLVRAKPTLCLPFYVCFTMSEYTTLGLTTTFGFSSYTYMLLSPFTRPDCTCPAKQGVCVWKRGAQAIFLLPHRERRHFSPSRRGNAGGHSMSLGLCPTKLPVAWEARADHPCVPAERPPELYPSRLLLLIVAESFI